MNLRVHQTPAVKASDASVIPLAIQRTPSSQPTQSMPGLAARFLAVGGSGTSLTPGLRSASKTRTPRSAVSQRSLHSQNIVVTGRRRSPPKRSLATHAATARSLEDEAFQDVFSQSHGHLPLTEVYDESVYDESLKAASPLPSPPLGSPSPRFDWRLRATSRAAARSGGLQPSRDGTDSRTYIKRVVPQHVEIQPGERFHHEANAYENR